MNIKQLILTIFYFLFKDLNGDNMGIFGKQSPANFNDQFTMNRSFPEKKL